MPSTFSTASVAVPADEARAKLVARYKRLRGNADARTLEAELYAIFLGGNEDAARKITALESLRVAAPQAPEPNVRRVRPPAARFRDTRRVRHA